MQKNQEFSVRIFGAGGGAKNNGSAGGGSGWMNNAVLILNEGELVAINIGVGGNDRIDMDRTGGTSSFDRYLSANGGTGGSVSGRGGAWGGNGGA